MIRSTLGREVEWSHLVPENEWALYGEVIRKAQSAALPFAVGGGLAFSTYARRWRNTKDMDLYIRPGDRQAFVAILDECGFRDYHACCSYDRGWIYRGHRDDVIVDLIWSMANYRATVELEWLSEGPEIQIRDLTVRVLPVEELVWSKLYVMQRDRCDWPDLLNILSKEVDRLDWQRLLGALGSDQCLFGGLLAALRWLCPSAAERVPVFVWDQVLAAGLSAGAQEAECGKRAALLDSRDWFGQQDLTSAAPSK